MKNVAGLSRVENEMSPGFVVFFLFKCILWVCFIRGECDSVFNEVAFFMYSIF